MEMPGPLNDDQRRQLSTVEANGKHLLAIINDLLDLAKIEAGKVDLVLAEVGCQELLDEIAGSLRPLAEEKGLRLEVVPVNEAVRIRTDHRALKQVLLNLVNNAIKFTESGEVRLGFGETRDNGHATPCFSVTDTGVGIRPDERERLFRAFEQLEADASRRSEGTGLGLYISSKLTALLGGAIRFESEPGRGSKFMVEFEEGATWVRGSS
jgi:two-component system sensor histidine kinase/response regulator